MFLLLFQFIIAILLSVAILFQQRGGGLSPVLGGGGGWYATRRGAERSLFIGTIVLAILFFGLAFLNLVLR